MLEKIKNLTDHKIYKSFYWHDELPPFKKFNLIYGFNGSGKSTLGNFLRSLSLATEVEGQFELQVDGSSFSKNNVPESFSSNLQVFNKNFVDANVFPITGGPKPIYVVGEDNIKAQDNIKEIDLELSELNKQLSKNKLTKRNQEKALEDLIQRKAREIKMLLRASGTKAYADYNRRDLTDSIRSLRNDNLDQYELSDENYNLSLQIKNTNSPAQIEYHVPSIFELDPLKERIKNICQIKVNSQAIERLKNSNSISKWANEGLKLHKAIPSDLCHFCQNPLPENLIETLEEHFNDSFGQFQKEITSLHSEILWLRESLNINFPDTALFDPELRNTYSDYLKAFEREAEKRMQFLNSCEELVTEKSKSPFSSYSPEFGTEGSPEILVEKIKSLISKHNELYREHNKRIARIKKKLELHHVVEVIPEIDRNNESTNEIEHTIHQAEKTISALERKRSQLQTKIRDHHQSAKSINILLHLYLGRSDIKFESNRDGYALTRSGQEAKAHSLSEGEKTAVALVYFLQHLNGENVDKEKSIVVLDDPISSLDSNSIFSAFSFIRSQLKDCSQLFILTHSHFLYKHVRSWFNAEENRRDLAKGIRKKTSLLMIRTYVPETGDRFSEIDLIDELLEKYNSEYHFIFSKIYFAANTDGDANLIEAYSFPNMARRLLEAFFSYRYPAAQGGIAANLKRIPSLPPETRFQVERFLHYKSHFDNIDVESAHDFMSLSETIKTLRSVLRCIEYADREHFEEMKSLVI